MRKAPKCAPFLTLLLIGAALAFTAVWYRGAETPPWRPAAAESSSQPDKAPAPPRGREDHNAGPGGFSFVTYNVKNWLVSDQTPEKSPASKQAVIRMIANAAPDVIGLSEIGSREDAEEIRSMLEAEGMDFPHLHHTGGADPVRHLALLSRFPIVSTENPDPRIPGTGHSMQRGILSATVLIAGREIRFIGIHLKSKRIVREFDQAMLRIQEAGHVRKHIDGILAADPDALLVVYGDFNDTRRALSNRTIYGTYRNPGYMTPVNAKDSRGETWTYCYAAEDSYARIDFVTVSRTLKRLLKPDAAKVIDDPLWDTASDHRPVLVRFAWGKE